jgi:ribosomal protein S18 acetylase RimI-like enzyme
MTGARERSLTLRPATEADVPYLIALRERTMTQHQVASGAVPSDSERQQRVRFRFECASIIERAGEPVGLLKVAREGLDWQLIQIQLAPELQGQGIGRALIVELIDEARTRGASLSLHVLSANPARHLYERLGFRIVAEQDHGYLMRLGAGGAVVP